MLPIKIAIQTLSLGLSLRAALAEAKRLGAQAVELDLRTELRYQELSETGVRQIRKWLEDYELRVVAVSFLTRRGYNVQDELERRIEATKQVQSLAHALGASWVVNQVGHIVDDPADPSFTLLVDVLRELGTWGQRSGAILCAETGSESGPALAKLLAALPAGTIGVTLDPGNLIVNGYSVDEALTALGSEVVHVHVHDGVRDRATGRGQETQLGRGSVDWPTLLAGLEERNYRGYLSIERRDSTRSSSEISDAVRFLRSL